MKHIDTIIVGQGLAGSILAHTLLQENKTILVLDNNPTTSSSKIATGLFNPIVFKRITPSWRADEFIPVVTSFYTKTEQIVSQKVYYPTTLLRVIASASEKIIWEKKLQSQELSPFLENTDIQTSSIPGIESPYGYIKIKAGYIRVKEFLQTTKKFLLTSNSYREEFVEYTSIKIIDDKVYYKDYIANHIVFAEGYQAIHNPFFVDLPFQLSKGQHITIENKTLDKNYWYSIGCHVVPHTQKDTYQVGATYSWSPLDTIPTLECTQELTKKLEQAGIHSFEIIEQEAAIRPTVKDRRPFVFLHPTMPCMAMFNGFGSKTVMLAPFFAKELLQLMYKG